MVVAYAHLVDFGRASDVADLFTDDGVWEDGESRLDGAEAIRAGFAVRQARSDRRSLHVCTNVAIEIVSDEEATGITYLTLYRRDGTVDGVPHPIGGPTMVGTYRDRFRLVADSWRFAHRIATAWFVHE